MSSDRITEQRERVYRALVECPQNPCGTSARFIRITRPSIGSIESVNSRLRELLAAGRVERCGFVRSPENGRKVQAWRAVVEP